MDGIRLRRDLADLPEPRFVHVTPAWLRAVAAALGAVLAFAGGWLCYVEVAALQTDWRWFGGGAAVLMAGGFVLRYVLTGDARDWIDIAAAEDGLYLPGRRKGVMFVPWPSVTGISVVRPPLLDGRLNRLKLTLRLPEEKWNGFSRFAPIAGEGEVRSYTVPALAAAGEDLAAAIMAVHDGRAPHPSARTRG